MPRSIPYLLVEPLLPFPARPNSSVGGLGAGTYIYLGNSRCPYQGGREKQQPCLNSKKKERQEKKGGVIKKKSAEGKFCYNKLYTWKFCFVFIES